MERSTCKSDSAGSSGLACKETQCPIHEQRLPVIGNVFIIRDFDTCWEHQASAEENLVHRDEALVKRMLVQTCLYRQDVMLDETGTVEAIDYETMMAGTSHTLFGISPELTRRGKRATLGVSETSHKRVLSDAKRFQLGLGLSQSTRTHWIDQHVMGSIGS